MRDPRALRAVRNRARQREHPQTQPAPSAEDTAEALDKATVDRVAKLTTMARASWLGLLSYLAFIGVTLLGVQDADFFIPERETPLPLIGVSIPTNLFFYAAPALGAMLYVQLHLYLVKLWRALDTLPETASTPAGEQVAPWIVSDMALSRRPGVMHAYPLRALSNAVSFLFTFLSGPLVLAGLWWRSMPKHDELLTMVACGLPLFAAIVAGTESWRALRRGGAQERHMPAREKAGWTGVLLALSLFGFLTTEGTFDAYARVSQIKVLGETIAFTSVFERQSAKLEAELAELDEAALKQRFSGITDYPDPEDLAYLAEKELETRWWTRTWWPGFLRPAQLQNVVFVQTPPDWRPRDEAEQIFRPQWCTAQGIPHLACGPGPLAKDKPTPPHLAYQRQLYCQTLFGADPPQDTCAQQFQTYDDAYTAAWEKARTDALARLPERDLSRADLRGAILTGARMEGADLVHARMEGADLQYARMEGAYLVYARMEWAKLSSTRMEGANLFHARMQWADLRLARMEGAYLVDARMEGANLWSAQMKGADLRHARMEGADLDDARFDRSTVVNALSLRNAELTTVDLSKLDLSQAQVNESFGDASVTLPDRDAETGQPLTRPAHWPTWAVSNILGAGPFYKEWRKWQADPDAYVPPPPP